MTEESTAKELSEIREQQRRRRMDLAATGHPIERDFGNALRAVDRLLANVEARDRTEESLRRVIDKWMLDYGKAQAEIRHLREFLKRAVDSIKTNDVGVALERCTPWTIDWYEEAYLQVYDSVFEYNEAEICNRLSLAARVIREVAHAVGQMPLHFRDDVAEPVRLDYANVLARLNDVSKQLAQDLSVPLQPTLEVAIEKVKEIQAGYKSEVEKDEQRARHVVGRIHDERFYAATQIITALQSLSEAASE